MSPWSWWAGELGESYYDLGNEATREAVIRAAMREMSPGDQFRIIEARASEAREHEESDFVPFLRTRNEEVVTVGPQAALSTPETKEAR